MKKAIFATLSHCKSTDEHPQHNICPKEKDSWCFYNRAIANGEKPEPHPDRIKTPITEHVAAKITPLYQRLASDALFERCVSGKTQNANESLHGVIWSKCPKVTYATRQRLEICVSQSDLPVQYWCKQISKQLSELKWSKSWLFNIESSQTI